MQIRPNFWVLARRLSSFVHAGSASPNTEDELSDRHQRDTPPKKKAEVFRVDGVACSVTKAKDQGTANVTIGTSGFSNDQRITFRLSQLPVAASREGQVRAHKDWSPLLAASRLKGVESGGGLCTRVAGGERR